ncbi:MAG: hypothetical protein K1Y36_00700 [Blastocatellia bacterium]|nr:hypothetical protein [Blastocatellia bacterium]
MQVFSQSRRVVLFGCGVLLWGLLLPIQARFQTRSRQDGPSRFELENRARMGIKFEENQYRELLETCTELENTVKKFTAHFPEAPPPEAPAFTDEDIKDFKKIEKLAKKICSSQGEPDDDAEKKLPENFPEQLKMLSNSSQELHVQVRRNTRHTISVGVITRASRIIALMKRWVGRR